MKSGTIFCMSLFLETGMMKKTKQFWTETEIIKSLCVKKTFLVELEQQEIICPRCGKKTSDKKYSRAEVEKIRFAKTLMEEMDVNLPGVEVALRMRQNMIEMRRQFDSILEELAKEFQETRKG